MSKHDIKRIKISTCAQYNMMKSVVISGILALCALSVHAVEVPVELVSNAWTGNCHEVRIDGQQGWQSERWKDLNSRYFYFNVTDPAFKHGKAPKLEVTLRYLDTFAAPITFQYDSTDTSIQHQDGVGAWKRAQTHLSTGTGGYQTLSWYVSDANFANRCGDWDFRIAVGANVDFVIQDVVLRTVEDATSAVSAPAGAQQINHIGGEALPLSEYDAFLAKAQSGQPIRICYLGGSITCGAATAPRKGVNRDGKPFDYSSFDVNRDSWRALTYQWLKDTYEVEDGQFEQVNVAIGATHSEHAAFRLNNHVLAYQPDLLFIEFAVNDSGKGILSANDPQADRSIPRTLASIISRARAQNPDVAIFSLVTTHRENRIPAKEHWCRAQAKSAQAHIETAERLRVPYVDGKKACFEDPLPVGLERDRLFDGEESEGNFVHPSPQGHKAYAEAVNEALQGIFDGGSFPFKTAAADYIIPFPRGARLIEAAELQGSNPDWQLEVYSDRDWVEPSFIGEQSLVSTDSSKALVYEFAGTAVGAWLRLNTVAAFEVHVDGVNRGVYANGVAGKADFFGRGNIWVTGLEPGIHTLKLVPLRDRTLGNRKGFKLSLHALLVDTGSASVGDEMIHQKQVKASTASGAGKSIDDGFTTGAP